MNLFLLSIFAFLTLFLFFFVFYFFLKKKREREFLKRGMDLVLYLVTLPQEVEKGKEVSLKEHLKIAEQFYSFLAGFKEKNKIKRFLIGDPCLVFEIAVHRIGEAIYFYVACPRQISQMVEKQILGFWPRAQVQPSLDYNIFNPVGDSAGGWICLRKSPTLPLKTYQEFGADPLSSITNVFTKLAREGEGAAIQVLMRPSQKPIGKIGKRVAQLLERGEEMGTALKKAESEMGGGAFLRTFFEALFLLIRGVPKKEKEKKTEKEKEKNLQLSSQISPIKKEIVSAISRKAAKPLFEVNIRLLSSASNKGRADQILDQLFASFEQFNAPLLNQLKFKKLSGKLLEKLFYNFSFRIFDPAQTIVLSAEEMASIYHFPSPNLLLTPHIKWLKAKQVSPPPDLPKEGLLIGKNIFRGEERNVYLLKDDRRRHFYIVGQTGTGKSVLLQEMIRQDMEQRQGLCLIDPHGDLAERVLGLVPPQRIEETIYFNPGETKRPIGLNMLEYDPSFPESKTFVVNELLEIFEKLYNLKALGFGGPIYEQYMRNALLLTMEDPESGSTLIEIPRILSDRNFRRHKLSKCKNIVVKNFWELEAEKAKGELALANIVPYITSKMNIFIANDLVRPIVAQQKSSFDFRKIMDEGKILIVNLSKGKLGDINSYLLGMIIVGKILIAAFSRANIEEEKRKDFYLYIDEFHNVTTKTITSALAEARKFRLNMIFSHQFIGQLDEETRKAIFGNVGTILALRTGPEDAKYLITQYEPVFSEADLVNFDNFNGALRLLIKGETSRPFNIVTFPPTKGDEKIANLVKKYSRVKHGRDRERVESELYQRLKKSYGWGF